ncbi:MAG TPA: glyoxalase superfamily protein [Thermoanaerobaculia bacterium]|nr:glyoxalase superfamily protein [Thermoanaerobaculia bacterium]
MEQLVAETTPPRWYVRPVIFVTDVQRSLDFYVGKLGFLKQWHEADGKGGVCQVSRAGCEIILCQDARRQDRGRLYVELTREGLADLLRQAGKRSVPTQKSWWGHDVIRVVDPDGNELFFPLTD